MSNVIKINLIRKEESVREIKYQRRDGMKRKQKQHDRFKP